MKKFLLALVVAGAFFGYKFYRKQAYAKEFRAQVETACGGEATCLQFVNAYYDTCYEKAYDLGGRRRSGGMRVEKFAECINSEAKTSVFETTTTAE